MAVHRPARLRPGRLRARRPRRHGAGRQSMLDLDVAGRRDGHRDGDRDRARARRHHVRAARRDHPRLDTLVGSTTSSRRTTRRVAARPARPRAEGRRARAAAVRAGREHGRRRRALLAPARRRRGGLALLADRGVRVGVARPRAYSNAAVELFVEQGAKLEYVSLQNLSRETWHFATHHARVERDAELDWVAGGFGSKKGKMRIQNDLAGPGATSRVTGAYFADGDAAPRLRHVPGAHRAEHRRPTSPSRARSATRRARSGAG